MSLKTTFPSSKRRESLVTRNHVNMTKYSKQLEAHRHVRSHLFHLFLFTWSSDLSSKYYPSFSFTIYRDDPWDDLLWENVEDHFSGISPPSTDISDQAPDVQHENEHLQPNSPTSTFTFDTPPRAPDGRFDQVLNSMNNEHERTSSHGSTFIQPIPTRIAESKTINEDPTPEVRSPETSVKKKARQGPRVVA